MIAMRSPLGTPGRSKSRTMNPVAKENIPMCVIPIGTTRCSLPRTGVAAASANGYGATSCHPFAASFASSSVARRFVRRAAAAPAASGPLPRGGTNGFGRSIRGTRRRRQAAHSPNHDEVGDAAVRRDARADDGRDRPPRDVVLPVPRLQHALIVVRAHEVLPRLAILRLPAPVGAFGARFLLAAAAAAVLVAVAPRGAIRRLVDVPAVRADGPVLGGSIPQTAAILRGFLRLKVRFHPIRHLRHFDHVPRAAALLVRRHPRRVRVVHVSSAVVVPAALAAGVALHAHRRRDVRGDFRREPPLPERRIPPKPASRVAALKRGPQTHDAVDVDREHRLRVRQGAQVHDRGLVPAVQVLRVRLRWLG
eukprot:31399-Pelagococcus_subviridis.AAC.3